MKEEHNPIEEYNAIQQQLSQVPPGAVLFQRQDDSLPSPSCRQLDVPIQGKGRIQFQSLLPGAELSYHCYAARQVSFHHPVQEDVLQIHYCIQGRVGWNTGEGVEVYLGPGEVCIHSMENPADYRLTFPQGYCQAASLTLHLRQLEQQGLNSFQKLELDYQGVYQKLCRKGMPLGLYPRSDLEILFSTLCSLPEEEAYRKALCKTRMLWAMLILDCSKFPPRRSLPRYAAHQTQLIQQIRDDLVQHLDQPFPISQLAKTYPIPPSALKATFKGVYGMSVAAYLRQSRMQRAQQLLEQSDADLAEIARQVGWQSPEKFAKAFRKYTGVLPAQYRQQRRAKAL